MSKCIVALQLQLLDHQIARILQHVKLLFKKARTHRIFVRETFLLLLFPHLALIELGLKDVLLYVLNKQLALVLNAVFERPELCEELF